MALELLFLGTGTSAGVPMIGCHCEVCRSHDPRDNRTRPGVLIRYPHEDPPSSSENAGDQEASQLASRQFLIDTPPEMRVQLIRHQIDRIDGVLLTHTHADHVFGMDDLRRFNAVMKSPIPIYAEQSALDALRSTFSYIFEPKKHVNLDKTFVPRLIPSLIEASVPLSMGRGRWTPLRLMHGRLDILGFRVDYFVEDGEQPSASIAYCTDVSGIPPQTYPLLEGLDVLVIDALRYRHHPTHMTVDQALDNIDQIKPRRAYLTHIAHDIRHADLEAKLPEHVYLAFDGLTVDVQAISR